MRFLLCVVLCILAACQADKDKLYQIETSQLPTAGDSGLPYLESGLDGKLRCSWVETSGDTAILKYALYQGNTWSNPEEIAQGTNWFVNWADYPKISASENAMMAHFLQKSSPDTYAYDVMAKVRKSNGWSDPIKVHSDTTKTEHGFVSIVPLAGDRFQLAWLDGRNTSGSHLGAMTLRAGILDASGVVYNESLVDNKVCDCCATAATMTSDGPLVAFRDRSDQEIRDISLSGFSDQSWSPSVDVSNDRWKIEGCPVNGPSLDSHEHTVVLAWFTGAQNRPRVQMAFSNDNGANFGEPIVVDDQEPIGRVSVRMLNEHSAAVLWVSRKGEASFVRLKVIGLSGVVIKDMIITSTTESRASGFPQLERHGDFLYIANTQVGDEALAVQTHRLRYQ